MAEHDQPPGGHFHSEKWKTWRGTVQGDPTRGPIVGRVEGQGSRVWNLRGSVEDGILRATHFEVEGT